MILSQCFLYSYSFDRFGNSSLHFGQEYGEHRTSAFAGGYFDISAFLCHDLTRQIQSDPHAALVGRSV